MKPTPFPGARDSSIRSMALRETHPSQARGPEAMHLVPLNPVNQDFVSRGGDIADARKFLRQVRQEGHVMDGLAAARGDGGERRGVEERPGSESLSTAHGERCRAELQPSRLRLAVPGAVVPRAVLFPDGHPG